MIGMSLLWLVGILAIGIPVGASLVMLGLVLAGIYSPFPLVKAIGATSATAPLVELCPLVRVPCTSWIRRRALDANVEQDETRTVAAALARARARAARDGRVDACPGRPSCYEQRDCSVSRRSLRQAAAATRDKQCRNALQHHTVVTGKRSAKHHKQY